MNTKNLIRSLAAIPLLGGLAATAIANEVVHDAEYYVLAAQNGEKWAAEDKSLEQKLAELKKKHGTPPNIVHIMWDDTAFGDVGIPAIQQVRGLERMKLRHDLWKKKYPDSHEVYGIPWTGIANASPEIEALAKPQMDLSKLPFDPLEYVEHLDQIPFDRNMNPGVGD